ncbi:MAG TPA: tetratricopeptide repeat protein [Nitrospirae bacterium]|nr:tetratricopeptide repeat protein [Nitrospirota bacterium]
MMIRMTEAKWLLAAMAIIMALGITLPCATQAESAEKSSYDQAMEFYYAGKYEEAAKLLKEYVKDNADPKAYFRLGYSLYKLGRHEEANKYFDQSYLVTPAYTPTPELEEKHERLDDVRPEGFYEGKITLPDLQVEPPPKIPEGMAAAEEPSTLAVPTQEEEEEAAPEEEMETAETETEPEAEEAIEAKVEEEPVVEEPKPEKPAPEPAKPREPAQPVQPPFEMTEGQAKFAALAIISAFLIPIIAIFGLLYLLFSLSIFKIAKKLNVDKAFLAWIPLAQVFPFTWAAGKSTLWGIIFLLASLFLGPVGMIIGLYFWMCIAENLGKNKFLGLLMLVPLVNIAFMLYLGFSKSDVGGLAVISADAADVPDVSGELDLDLPDIPDDLDDMGDMGGGGDMDDMGEMPDLDNMDFDEPDLNESDSE